MDLPMRGTAARVCAAGMVCALFAAGSASANHPPRQLPIAKGVDGSSWSSYGLSAPSINTSTSSSFAAAKAAVLPPASDNVQLVSKLGLETPAQYRIDGTQGQALLPGQIADVTVHKNTAYLNSWAEDDLQARRLLLGRHHATRRTRSSSPSCRRAAGQLPRRGRARDHGQHAGGFQGDLLAVNNETCSTRDATCEPGGFDLYDVSDPAEPADAGAVVRRPDGRSRGRAARSGR